MCTTETTSDTQLGAVLETDSFGLGDNARAVAYHTRDTNLVITTYTVVLGGGRMYMGHGVVNKRVTRNGDTQLHTASWVQQVALGWPAQQHIN